MTNRRNLLRLAALALSGASMPLAGRAVAAAGTGASAALVQSTGDQLVAIAGGERQKRAGVERVVDASVDVDGIARFCLGRFWPRASADQQREFIQVVRAVLVTSVAQRLDEYRGARFSVASTQPRDGGDLVATTIERQNGGPSRVDWLVTQVNGSARVEDMISAGVSMRITQRNDYESFLNNNGGNVGLLIRGLQQKAAQMAAAS
jgi:phospholipid transport system substrate-binding protein